MSQVTERIAQHCKRLKLIHLATEWPAIAESSAKGQDSMADFMEKLLAAECAAREQRTREAMLKLATLPAIKTLEGHTAWVQGVVFLAQGTRLATVGADQTVRLWDLAAPAK